MTVAASYAPAQSDPLVRKSQVSVMVKAETKIRVSVSVDYVPLGCTIQRFRGLLMRADPAVCPVEPMD